MWHGCLWDSHQPKDSRIQTSAGPITAFNNDPASIIEAVKDPEIQNVKQYIKHNNQHNLLQKQLFGLW